MHMVWYKSVRYRTKGDAPKDIANEAQRGSEKVNESGFH